jgi:hypothetical protein
MLKRLLKRGGSTLLGAALCTLIAMPLRAHPGEPFVNERAFTNLTLGSWTLRLLACRPGGGMEVYSCDRRVAPLTRPGDEYRMPTQEGVEVRYRSWTDLRFALEDGRGDDGGVVFRVGRGLELGLEGGLPEDLERVLDLRLLALGQVDLMEPEWPLLSRRPAFRGNRDGAKQPGDPRGADQGDPLPAGPRFPAG